MFFRMESNSGRRSLDSSSGVELRDAGFGVGVDHREIELVFGGVQIDEQIVDFVQHFLDARIRPVDLVDHQNGWELGFERLHQNVASLRQRAFARVHQQHHAVHDHERALHFAAEIAVAGRVDDVDLHAVVVHAGGLGENGDAALSLQLVGVHHALHRMLVGAEQAALREHGVHQRGFAVIDVRDDGDIANRLVVHRRFAMISSVTQDFGLHP